MHRLEENLGSAAVELTSDDLREIDGAASRIEALDGKNVEWMEKVTDEEYAAGPPKQA